MVVIMQSIQQPIQRATRDPLVQATLATQRFSLGPLPHEIKKVSAHPQQWLLAQLTLSPAVHFDPSLPSANDILMAQATYKKAKKEAKQQTTPPTNNMSSMMAEVPLKNPNSGFYKQLTADALQQSIKSEHGFNWRCLDFFSNHFSVTAQDPVMMGLAATLEREAIAPHLLGHFDDLLLAVCQHPAMLIYLNNEKSIGPSTRFAKKNRGLNENLAREILELHTLGVNGGYLQQDVTELAKGITGWSVAIPAQETTQGFIFRAQKHEPGKRVLLGKQYPEEGQRQGEAMLKDIANHPSTARFISTKIIQSFISDEAPEVLIEHLTQQWIASHGHLKTVFSALVTHPLAWQLTQQKYKTPREFVVSTYRALNLTGLPIKQVQNALRTLGQAPFKAGSPAGYGDQQQDWDGANALMARINWVAQLTGKKNLANMDVNAFIDNTFAQTLSTNSYQVITRAESRQQALILALLSPEFLRR